MKKILSMFLVLCMVMTMLPMTAAYASEGGVIVEGTGYTYDTETDVLTITSNAGATYSSGWRTDYINEVKSIIIEDTVTQLGQNAFSSVPNLTSVKLGAGVSSVAPEHFAVFINCPSLESVTVDEDNTTYKDIDGVLFSKDGKKLIRYPDGKQDESYEIPDGVELIDLRAFYYNENIKSVSMPDSVTIIRTEAFYKCKGLTTVTLGNSVTEIGVLAFALCSKLTGINLPPTITTIGNRAFSSCSMLESVRIPAGVTSLGGLLFSDCNNLKDIFMDPEEAPVIIPFVGDSRLFSDSMTTKITIPIGATGYTAENYWPVDKVIEGRASLSGLTLISATLSPSFSPNVTDYTVAVPDNIYSITITPTIGLGTGLTVNSTSRASGQNTSVTLDADGDTNISIVVYNDAYPDEAKTYTITVIKVCDLNVSVTPGNGKITLAPQTSETGYAYYYKTTSDDDSLAKPAYGSVEFNSSGWTEYDAETDNTSTGADEIFVQVVKVRDADSKIYGWGQASAAPLTYTISGTITGSDTSGGIPATVQLKNSSNENVGSPVTAGADGAYTINNVPAGTGYTIEVSCAGYDSGTIASFDVTTENITGKDLTLIKTIVFKPVTDISGVATTGIAGTDVILSGVVTPADATNKTIVWSLGDGSTADNAMVSDNKASASGAGTVVVKATIINGAAADTDYTQEFVITFSEPTPIIYTVTFDTNGGTRTGGGELTQSVAHGESATAPILIKSGYTFSGWDKPLANITATQTITAKWTANSTGGGSSGTGGNSTGSDENSSGSSAIITITPPAPDNPDAPTQAEIRVPVTVDSNNAKVNITGQMVNDAINKAQAEADKNGYGQNAIALVLSVDTGTEAIGTVTVNLPKAVQEAIIANNITSTIIVVNNPDIHISMDLETVTEINKQANADVNITATPGDISQLNEEAGNAVGNRPVFDISVNVGSGSRVQNFGDGSVWVTVPYTLGDNEKAENICAVYIDEKGNVHWLTNSVYDSEKKVLRFRTNHFSLYGVGHNDAASAYTDVAGHWAKNDIEFVASRGLFAGTSKTTFSPNTGMTRGMFVTVLGRLAGVDVSKYTNSSFTDVDTKSSFMAYIEWARENNIVAGTGNGKFAPDAQITREQMAAILLNYTKAMEFILPKINAERAFADSGIVSDYAREAVKAMQTAGILNGRGNNLFDPQSTATRAEVSTLFCRFVELMISGDTLF